MPHRFHARHHAVARRYLYQIARRRTAFAKAYVWWVKEPLDAEPDARRGARVRRHARLPIVRGVADARDEGEPPPSTLVLVDQLEIVEEGDLLLVSIEGSHFLWKMVRRMVGVLVEIGRGGDAARRDPDDARGGIVRAGAPDGAAVGTVSRDASTTRATRRERRLARRRRSLTASGSTAVQHRTAVEAHAEHEADDLVVARRARLDAIRFQVRVVHAPARRPTRAG